ncbi:hypothetical protein [Nonomuraea sediminis]|uniref:hypothetical protein n=1 Tax=Nonomuraea sediminis TaxID=2835864 RepID=UPI001BDC0127|nr:hypothetical protein [Nonomuraea sediminis]
MISREVRAWLLSMAIMSIVSWVATASSLLILIGEDSLNGYAAALLLVWILAVSTPVTFHAISGWQRVRAVRRAFALGQKHARLFENMSGKITASLR